jgi:hypothetical protein
MHYLIVYEQRIMPKRNDNRTIEDIREQGRLRQKRFYNKHIKTERTRKRVSQTEKRQFSKKCGGDARE